jgi:hypothetical protein
MPADACREAFCGSRCRLLGHARHADRHPLGDDAPTVRCRVLGSGMRRSRRAVATFATLIANWRVTIDAL